MCFSSGSSKAPPQQQPTTFSYANQSQDTVARQAAVYESQGYTNRANYGADLTSGSPAISSTPEAAQSSTSALSGGQ
jgi:hypothetical protein